MTNPRNENGPVLAEPESNESQTEPAENLGETKNLVKTELAKKVPTGAKQVNGRVLSSAVSEANGHAATETAKVASDSTERAVLRACANESETTMMVCEPWLFKADAPSGMDKKSYNKWRANPTAKHLLFTGAEGTNPGMRVNNKTNPVRRLHALIADFDIDVSDAMEEGIIRNAPSDARPNWISTTFSGGRRLVWLFEEPIPIDSDLPITKEFLKVAAESLRVGTLFAGLDDNWYRLQQIYDVGRDWRSISDELLSKNSLHHWLFQAAQRLRFRIGGKAPTIPLDKVVDEVERQFPGVWEGEFTEGSRGCVFWEGRSNPTAAIVCEAGMIAFSSHKLFHSWAEVLGPAFVRKFQDDKIGASVADVFHDGRSYFRKIGGRWASVAGADFVKWLCAEHGLDSTRGKNEKASQTSQAEVYVQNNRRVDGLAPFLFNRRDVVVINGKRFLNCSCVKPVEPHEERQEWRTNFPWIARFLELRFDETERQYFLGWWHRFYCSAIRGDLLKGHSLFIVGGTNTGKTLMSYHMVGASVGGAADATAHIVKGTEFNKELCEVALRCIDDGEVASDPVSHRKFSEAVKRMVANPVINYRAMYKDAQSVKYNGRLLVTLNDDSHSLQMVPDLALSNEEKLMILKFRNTPYTFPETWQLEPMIAAELPFLLRWLVDWSPPEEIVGDNRLGVKSYINEDLRAKALAAGQTGDLLEIIDLWEKRNGFESNHWLGTASEWFSTAMADDALRPLLSKFTPRVIGKRFSDAARMRNSGIEIAHESSKGNRYSIKVSTKCERKAARGHLK